MRQQHTACHGSPRRDIGFSGISCIALSAIIVLHQVLEAHQRPTKYVQRAAERRLSERLPTRREKRARRSPAIRQIDSAARERVDRPQIVDA